MQKVFNPAAPIDVCSLEIRFQHVSSFEFQHYLCIWLIPHSEWISNKSAPTTIIICNYLSLHSPCTISTYTLFSILGNDDCFFSIIFLKLLSPLLIFALTRLKLESFYRMILSIKLCYSDIKTCNGSELLMAMQIQEASVLPMLNVTSTLPVLAVNVCSNTTDLSSSAIVDLFCDAPDKSQWVLGVQVRTDHVSTFSSFNTYLDWKYVERRNLYIL